MAEVKHDERDDIIAKLEARLARVEAIDAGDVANPIVAMTCNSCGKTVEKVSGKCATHPSEHVNHMSVGRDPETGLKRPTIARQTRAA